MLIDSIIDGMFLVDMILMGFTSFVGKEGKEIKVHTQILRKYVMSVRGFFDFIALFGTGFVT